MTLLLRLVIFFNILSTHPDSPSILFLNIKQFIKINPISISLYAILIIFFIIIAVLSSDFPNNFSPVQNHGVFIYEVRFYSRGNGVTRFMVKLKIIRRTKIQRFGKIPTSKIVIYSDIQMKKKSVLEYYCLLSLVLCMLVKNRTP